MCWSCGGLDSSEWSVQNLTRTSSAWAASRTSSASSTSACEIIKREARCEQKHFQTFVGARQVILASMKAFLLWNMHFVQEIQESPILRFNFTCCYAKFSVDDTFHCFSILASIHGHVWDTVFAKCKIIGAPAFWRAVLNPLCSLHYISLEVLGRLDMFNINTKNDTYTVSRSYQWSNTVDSCVSSFVHYPPAACLLLSSQPWHGV